LAVASFCEGKVAVVTGAGGTLCSCIAKDLALKGAKVVLIGRTREKLEKVAAEITGGSRSCATADAQERVPPSVRIEPGDVTDEKAMQEIADRVLAEWGPCRFLVNGAGGNNVKAMPTRLRFSEADLTPTTDFDKDRGFWDIDLAAFKSVLEINTLGTVIPSKVFGRQMAKAGGGSILNFGSMNTYRPLTRVAPYAMSKAAIANWTMFFAQYMAPAKVRVNAVAPGFMVNERSKQYLMTPDGGLSPRGEQVMHHTPAGRFGEAQDLLGCVDWLLDDAKSAFVTGITVPVDGGFLASAGV
jgi:NAD(P)-dependent dehydrogenase (short-subunit alcohol dehydrogenase family)